MNIKLVPPLKRLIDIIIGKQRGLSGKKAC